jgi:hypothetical protein
MHERHECSSPLIRLTTQKEFEGDHINGVSELDSYLVHRACVHVMAEYPQLSRP